MNINLQFNLNQFVVKIMKITKNNLFPVFILRDSHLKIKISLKWEIISQNSKKVKILHHLLIRPI